MTSLVLTVSETLRYRGAIGQWSWVLHRITGLGVVLFIVLHIVDTSWAVFYPEMYVRAIAEYQSPLFTLGEFALVACVVYHGFNGLRIIVFDYKPAWWKYQQRAAWWVLGLSVVVLIPTFIGMFGHVVDFYNNRPQVLPLIEVITGQLRFAAGMVGAFVAALILSALYSAIAGSAAQTPKKAPSRIERFWWSYMRVSGVLILPLAFGHLAMMHIIQGVFDIQFNAAAAQHFAVGAIGAQVGMNTTGTAVEFVADRWGTLVAGVAIWRLYDVGMLALVVIHGFNGLRLVFTDYASSPVLKRALVYTCIIGALVLLILGGGALLYSVNDQAIQLAQQAFANLHP